MSCHGDCSALTFIGLDLPKILCLTYVCTKAEKQLAGLGTISHYLPWQPVRDLPVVEQMLSTERSTLSMCKLGKQKLTWEAENRDLLRALFLNNTSVPSLSISLIKQMLNCLSEGYMLLKRCSLQIKKAQREGRSGKRERFWQGTYILPVATAIKSNSPISTFLFIYLFIFLLSCSLRLERL